MAGQKTSLEFNTFVAGIITEAGPLTFPENASLDEENFVLNTDGSRQRRLGMDYEAGYQINPSVNMSTASDVAAFSTFEWANAGSRGNLDILVVQTGRTLSFYDKTLPVISENLLQTFGAAVPDGTRIAYGASLAGRFISTSPGTTKAYAYTIDTVTLAITREEFLIQARDTWGAFETTAVDNRPSSLSTVHDYNLRNQGWPNFFQSFTQPTEGAQNIDPVPNTFNFQGFYPSSADIIWQAKVNNPENLSQINSYSSWLLVKVGFGSSAAPRGKHIFTNVFTRGARRESFRNNNSTLGKALDLLPVDETIGSLGPVAAYAGRAFYSVLQEAITDPDESGPNLGSMIFFSQVADSISRLGKCYSENDPTAEEFNQTLATDGGFISIPEMGRVVAMEPLGNSLFVLATNGVWEIHGGESGFSATNQNVTKTSTAGCISPRSIVTADGLLSYWSEGGIYIIQIDTVSQRGSAINLTEGTVQKLYNNIYSSGKATAAGVYDRASRQVRWLYKEAALENPFIYNKELIYDTRLKAFYRNTIGRITSPGVGIDQPWVAGYATIPFVVFAEVTDPVEVLGVNVTAAGEDVTYTLRSISADVAGSVKYVTVLNDTLVPGSNFVGLTFSHYREPDFIDWKTVDGVGLDAPAFLLTGYWTGGLSSREKSVPSITTHMRRTEQGFTDNGTGGDSFEVISPSSCLMQAQWAWTDSPAANRFGDTFQAYKLPRTYTPEDVLDEFDYGFTVVSTRNTLRGHGEALSLKFSTEAGKDCHIYGWSKEVFVEGSN